MYCGDWIIVGINGHPVEQVENGSRAKIEATVEHTMLWFDDVCIYLYMYSVRPRGPFVGMGDLYPIMDK